MRRETRRRGRGQAMVELVLGTIVFVTILIFLIHFAEVGALAVKVTEAAHSAMFDATGHKLHQWPSNVSDASSAASKAASDGAKRYGDFDSRTAKSGASLSEVFTRAAKMQVTCGLNSGLKYQPHSMTSGAYKDNGGITCQASSKLYADGPWKIPQQVLDQGDGALFAVDHYVPRVIGVCNLGRGGNCQGKLVMLLDDWGLSGPDESGTCVMKQDNPTACSGNKPYWRLADAVFTKGGRGRGSAGSKFAKDIVGVVPPMPGGENAFYLSFTGSDPEFMQDIKSEGKKPFPTSPYPLEGNDPVKPYKTAHKQRGECFLGQKCPKG